MENEVRWAGETGQVPVVLYRGKIFSAAAYDLATRGDWACEGMIRAAISELQTAMSVLNEMRACR